MYVCITDAAGTILVHKNLKTDPDAFTRIIEPYREDLAVAVECVFVWYRIADLCEQLGVTFVLGHALYRCAIHGGKVKNDRIDSEKIAQLLLKRDAAGGVCVSRSNEIYAGSSPAANVLGSPTSGAPGAYPEHTASVQPSELSRNASTAP